METGTVIKMTSSHNPLVICVAEDRKLCEPALKLLLMSLCLYSTDIKIIAFYPPADQEFLDWAHQLHSKTISVRTTRILGGYGWNVKPQALLQLLSEGNQEAVWIDADIIATKDISLSFTHLNHDVLVLTEEALLVQNEVNAMRARLWGFPVARKFPFPLNTAVMRVTQNHVPLLKRWKEILESPEYKRAQQQPVGKRAIHMVGDQDVLTALLSSEEFSAIPVKILRRGNGIVQFFGLSGFTLAERVTCMVQGMPIFIHSQGIKPWILSTTAKPAGVLNKIYAAYQDLSPYTLVARKMASAQTETWTRPRSKLSWFLSKLGFGYLPLVGLPLAAAFDLERISKDIIKKVLNRLYPDAIFTARAWRSRRHFRNAFLARQNKMKNRIYNEADPIVLSGPFAGMKYLNEIVWGPIEPKWLGTYEQELHSIVEQILHTSYANIIDVGSAEGFYAVAFAMKFPLARVYSYDIDPWARRQQRRLARLNGVENLEISNLCTGKELTSRISGCTLLVCDIEGSEYELLNPVQTPVLRKCDILVELQDHLAGGFTIESGKDELLRRFSSSHEVTTVSVGSRTASQLDTNLCAKLTAQEFAECIDECRLPDQLWLWLKALSRPRDDG